MDLLSTGVASAAGSGLNGDTKGGVTGGMPAGQIDQPFNGVDYVDDVFSTYLHTGNGATQTINNGIDLAGKGGMVWVKTRSTGTTDHMLTEIPNYYLATNSTSARQGPGSSYLNAFNSDGFSVGANGSIDGTTYASWTFRKAPKFFDVVTYTGDGVAGRQIPHALGSPAGMVIVKRTNLTGSWRVWHTATGTNNTLQLNTTGALNTANSDYVRTADATTFTVGPHDDVNLSGGTYVAYLYAHDTSADGIIQCGGVTADGSRNVVVDLGWEPQYVLYKRRNNIGDWQVTDNIRGMYPSKPNTDQTPNPALYPNLSNAENNNGYIGINATGFTWGQLGTAGDTYIYMAIRRPNKVPTSGTEVYKSAVVSSTTPITYVDAPFPADLVLGSYNRTAPTNLVMDRLRGGLEGLITSTTAGADTFSYKSYFDDMTGVNFNEGTGNTNIWHMLKRAKGFFDIVCYTGTGVARTVNHNLGVVPELMIVKKRAVGVADWRVYVSADKNLLLHTTDLLQTDLVMWNNATPTTTVFSLGNRADVNENAGTYVAYLFATLSGISKVGSYTGNGTTQTIPCGFTTGARFILIKRTDLAGDWYIWDTARGIVAANDPHLSLNTTAAEVTTDDSIDPDASGFIVNQVAATNVNVLNGTYIFLAIS